MVGFSCHDDWRAAYLMSAAQGGFLDAIMVKYTPFFTKGDAFDKALDACHKAGIGLIAMKTMRNTQDVPKRVPEFDKMGLEVHQALLHAVWSDQRISAVCNMIDNVSQMESTTAAARSYKQPLSTSHVETLRQLVLAGRRHHVPRLPGLRRRSAPPPPSPSRTSPASSPITSRMAISTPATCSTPWRPPTAISPPWISPLFATAAHSGPIIRKS